MLILNYKMNFLPKELEDIIIDYKHGLEHREKFTKTLNQIKSLHYWFHCEINGDYPLTLDLNYPIILKQLNTHYELNNLIITRLHTEFKRKYDHITCNIIEIITIEHKGYQVYRDCFSDRERVMTDEYLSETVYGDYK